ncbi:TPA: hypothetical protein ACH3X1_006347 [Trebouxia sp. C0004]
MESKGFGAEYTKRYKMVNQFHQERRPLIIIVCGAPCTGKSSLAQQLASRFNMPNVLQTDMFYELLRTSKDKPLHQRPLWERPDLRHAQLITEFQRECNVVRRSIDGDLVKTIRDGKSIIIEGLHLDPGLYLYEFGKYGIRHLHTRSDSWLPSGACARPGDAVLVEPVHPEPINPDAAVQQGAELQPDSSHAKEAPAPPPGPRGRTKESNIGLLGSAQGLLQSTPGRQAASAGTGMLFALRSMAIRMSPVLSSYVSHNHAEDQCVNGQDNPAGNPQLAHSPGSEWIAQQLQKAYHGLTATLTPGSNAQPAQPDSPTSAQDVREQQDLSPPEQQHQHALEAVSDSQHAGHRCIGRESRLSQSPASQPDSPRQTQSVMFSKPESTAPGRTESPASAPPLSATPVNPSHQKQVLQSQQLQQKQQQQQSQQLDYQQQQQQQQQQPQQLDQQQQQRSSDGEQQKQQEQRSNDGEQAPAGGNEGRQAGDACKADQLEWVPDPVPAAVVLEQPEDSRHTPPEFTVTISKPCEAAPASSDAQTDIGQPQVEASEGQEQAQKKSSPAPVFVPIVVAMDARDHKLLVEEWYSRQMAMSGQLSNKDVSDKDMTDAANATYSRIRLLQDHLCTYAERNVPVVSINFSNFPDTLDQLHDYLLQCIESAMAQH